MTKEFAAKLARALAPYGDGVGLPSDHPIHALRALQKELTERADTEEARASLNALKRSSPTKEITMTATDVQKAAHDAETTLNALGEKIADAANCSIEKGMARAYEARPDLVRKLRGWSEPEPASAPVAKADSPQDAAWQEIEVEAGKIVEKSRYTLTPEAAIDRILKSRPDLARKFYGREPLPNGARR